MEYVLNIAYIMSRESFPQPTQLSHELHFEYVSSKQANTICMYVFNSVAVAPNGANN